MQTKAKHSLQRTMIIYFLLIGFASLLVGVEFIVDTHGHELKDELVLNFEKYSKKEIETDDIFSPIEKLRNKAILMIIIIMAVMIIVLTMFIKNITEPLQHMIEVSREISSGDLSQTIKIHSDNELSELGNVINEMSSNLQEIILVSKTMCSSGEKFYTQVSDILNQQSLNSEQIAKVWKEIKKLKINLDLVKEFIDYFHFYSVEK
jgi:methyl-accepting chemotaxis protein